MLQALSKCGVCRECCPQTRPALPYLSIRVCACVSPSLSLSLSLWLPLCVCVRACKQHEKRGGRGHFLASNLLRPRQRGRERSVVALRIALYLSPVPKLRVSTGLWVG